MSTPLAIGIDLGTSGVRAVAMDAGGGLHGQAGVAMSDHGEDHRDPRTWQRATTAALDGLLGQVEPRSVVALAVDGTSGTVLATDGDGAPVGRAMMYNDAVDDRAVLDAIAAVAPPTSAAHGSTSALAKAIVLARGRGVTHIAHQADWIASLFSGELRVSDENNALKTGYDPVGRAWPAWIAQAGADADRLPRVIAPGTPVATVTPAAAERFGLPAKAVVVAGTTDGCASFLATGATGAGDGVTALGTSMTIKLLSDRPIFAPEYGIYSHRIGDVWLAGGASNTGGKVLKHFFPVERIVALTGAIDPETDTGLDYYPLVGKGERFPVNDAALEPRLEPRPEAEADFLKALFEGMAGIEALAYRRLRELGAPPLSGVRSVGGGARNPVWTRIRERRLGVPMLPAASEEAAAGTARLALQGARVAGLL